MGLGVEHLNTDVVRPRIQMVLYTSTNRFHCRRRVNTGSGPHDVMELALLRP
jgi:hypothetical protein